MRSRSAARTPAGIGVLNRRSMVSPIPTVSPLSGVMPVSRRLDAVSVVNVVVLVDVDVAVLLPLFDAPATTASARQAMEGAADGLMSAHADLARIDLRSPDAVREMRRDLEVQLAMVAECRELVEQRVREIQALLVEQYKRGEADPDDWLR